MNLIVPDNSILWSILALCFGGLGFITYKHPTIARQILRYCMAIVLLIFLCHRCYVQGAEMLRTQSSYSMQLTWGKAYRNYVSPQINIDSIETVYRNNPDTVLDVIKQTKLVHEKQQQFMNSREEMLMSLIEANANGLVVFFEELNRAIIFYQIALWGLAILFLVSYFFKDERKPIGKKKNDSRNKATQ